MRAIIVDCLSSFGELPVFGGKNSLYMIDKSLGKIKYDRIVLLQTGNINDVPDDFKSITVNRLTLTSVVNTILKEAKNCEEIVLLNGTSPFFDAEYTLDMIDRHEKFLADYTYALGYPAGLTPQIISKNILPSLLSLIKEDDDFCKDYIFKLIARDINSFDIETLLSPDDVRLYRISIGNSDEGEALFTKKLFENNINTFDKILEYCKDNPDALYTVPYMILIELTNNSGVNSIYLPDLDENIAFIDIDFVKKYVKELKKINSAVTVVIGGLGEPLLHPEFCEIAADIANEGICTIIETDGQHIDEEFCIKLAGQTEKNIKKITFVVKCDSLNKEIYRNINKNGDFDKTIRSVILLKEKGFKVYRQFVRLGLNENDMETLVSTKDMDNVIIRKFSTYCKKLDDMKVVDLSPVERIPCFLLRRELCLRSDGYFYYCRYSVDARVINEKYPDINKIIKLMEKSYSDNAVDNYKEFCIDCDDYYLFGF